MCLAKIHFIDRPYDTSGLAAIPLPSNREVRLFFEFESLCAPLARPSVTPGGWGEGQCSHCVFTWHIFIPISGYWCMVGIGWPFM